jgi:two-component system chemotaxis response regulator CheB
MKENNRHLLHQQSIPDSRFAIVAIASSAGGLAALSTVLSGLPGGFPVPVAIVQHLDARHRSMMAEILTRRTPLLVKQAEEGDKLLPGHVYIAPPDYHLLVNSNGTLSLSHSVLVRFVRPSADRLFESVAASYGERSIAVVLTGSGSDGETGVKAVKDRNGMVIAQDEKTSEYFGMPGAAIATNSVDLVLALEEIAPALVKLVMKESEQGE